MFFVIYVKLLRSDSLKVSKVKVTYLAGGGKKVKGIKYMRAARVRTKHFFSNFFRTKNFFRTRK